MIREGKFFSNMQTPVLRSESPLSSLTASTTGQQDDFSEAVQTSRGHGAPAEDEHEILVESLRSSRNREEILEHKLFKAEAGQEAAQRKLQKANSKLEQAHVTIQQQWSNINENEKERADLLDKLKQANDNKMELEARILVQGGTNVSAIAAGLRNTGDALAVASQKISLDVFDNAIDRVPEVSVMSNVDNINEALEDLVSDVLDDAAKVRTSTFAGCSTDPREQFNNDCCFMPILNALTLTELTEANRGLLLAAFFHHVVIELMHSLIFCGEGATFTITETRFLNELFDHISENGAWVSSRLSHSIIIKVYRIVDSIAEVARHIGIQSIGNLPSGTMGRPCTTGYTANYSVYRLGIFHTLCVIECDRTEDREGSNCDLPRRSRVVCDDKARHPLRPYFRRGHFQIFWWF